MTVSSKFLLSYGPWALVAGGSEGLGASFANALASRGMKLILVARRAEPLTAFAQKIRDEHRVEVRTVTLDLAKEKDLMEVIKQAHGLEVGFLVVNAASAPIGRFLEQALEIHERVINTNCRAPAILCREFGQKMAERGRGGIILVSSLAGFQGTALVAHYAATKAYLRVLAEGLWEELRPHGVHVLACCAGMTDTQTFRRSQPNLSPWAVTPPMQPDRVAEEALSFLGKQPVSVPGWRNRLAQLFMQTVLPRKLSIALISGGTRRMYPRRP